MTDTYFAPCSGSFSAADCVREPVVQVPSRIKMCSPVRSTSSGIDRNRMHPRPELLLTHRNLAIAGIAQVLFGQP